MRDPLNDLMERGVVVLEDDERVARALRLSLRYAPFTLEVAPCDLEGPGFIRYAMEAIVRDNMGRARGLPPVFIVDGLGGVGLTIIDALEERGVPAILYSGDPDLLKLARGRRQVLGKPCSPLALAVALGAAVTR